MQSNHESEQPFIEKEARFSGMTTAQLEHLIGAFTQQLHDPSSSERRLKEAVDGLTDIRSVLTAQRTSMDEDDPQAGSLEVMLTEIDVALETYNFFLLTGEHRDSLEN